MSIAAGDAAVSAGARRPRPAPAATLARRPRRARLYLGLGTLSLLLAAMSLRLPSTPDYDPWAWIIWGREIMHFDLVTSGGPTWKPLPMIFTTLFAPFGSASPELWLVVARAGGPAGSAGSPSRSRAAATTRIIAATPPLVAGTIAAISLLVLAQYIYDVSLGYSEGLLISLTLLAIHRHLDGARAQAFVLGFGASLDRPEIWPFLGLYAVYLWRREPGARKVIVVLLALIPPLWLLPDLLGSGSLVRGVKYAMYPRGPATARCPFCTEITANAWPLVTAPFKVGILLFLAPAIARVPGLAGRDRRTLARSGARFVRSYGHLVALFLFGIGLFLEDAMLTEAGFSGNDRYLFLAASMLIAVGAVAWAGIVTWLGRLFLRITSPTVGVLAALFVSVSAFVAISPGGVSGFTSFGLTLSQLRYQAQLREDLPKAVEDAGGAKSLIACGVIETNPQQAPLSAWTLGLRLVSLQSTYGGDVLIQTRSVAGAPLEPNVPSDGRYRLAASIRTVRIFTDCG